MLSSVTVSNIISKHIRIIFEGSSDTEEE